MPREVERLIESTGAAPRWMKRDGNHDVRVFEHGPAALPDQRGKRTGQRPPSLVLDRVDDGPKRPVVCADGSGASHEGRTPAAPGTRGERQADNAP